MSYEIRTSKFNKEKRVLIDGMDWKVKMPGAGSEMAWMQNQRRLEFIEKRIKNGTATEEDLDKAEALESKVLGFFTSIFSDGTEDNASVKEWVNDNSFDTIQMVMEEMKKQFEENADETAGNKTTGSSEGSGVSEAQAS